MPRRSLAGCRPVWRYGNLFAPQTPMRSVHSALPIGRRLLHSLQRSLAKSGILAPGADCSPCRASFNRCATGPCGLALRGITGAAIAGRLSEDQSSRSPQRRLPPILENRAFCHGDFPPPVPWRGLRVKHTPVHSIVSFAVVRVGGVGRCRAWLAYQDLHPSHQPLSTRRRRRDEFELDARP